MWQSTDDPRASSRLNSDSSKALKKKKKRKEITALFSNCLFRQKTSLSLASCCRLLSVQLSSSSAAAPPAAAASSAGKRSRCQSSPCADARSWWRFWPTLFVERAESWRQEPQQQTEIICESLFFFSPLTPVCTEVLRRFFFFICDSFYKSDLNCFLSCVENVLPG